MPNPTPGQVNYEAWFLGMENTLPVGSLRWNALDRRTRDAWEAAAQAVRGVPTTCEEKRALNQWAQARYDALRQEGTHGHYETMFRVIHEALARREHDDA